MREDGRIEDGSREEGRRRGELEERRKEDSG